MHIVLGCLALSCVVDLVAGTRVCEASVADFVAVAGLVMIAGLVVRAGTRTRMAGDIEIRKVSIAGMVQGREVSIACRLVVQG